jgi:hypothetical protein
MRRATLALAVLTLAVALGSSIASASSSTVNLLTPTTGTITFSPNGGDPEMTISGTLTGTAMGTGAFGGASTYTLSGSLVFTPTGPHDYASMGTLSFELNNGTLLTGTLSGVTLEQVGKLLILTGNLTMSSGTSGVTGGQVAIVIDLPSGTALSSLTSIEVGSFSVGEGVGSVTPEPGTMLLFGSGILVFAGVVRRKRATSSAQRA